MVIFFLFNDRRNAPSSRIGPNRATIQTGESLCPTIFGLISVGNVLPRAETRIPIRSVMKKTATRYSQKDDKIDFGLQSNGLPSSGLQRYAISPFNMITTI